MAKKNNDMRFKRTNIKPSSNLKFDGNLLKLYLTIDENKSVRELFQESEMSSEDFKKNVIRLAKLNLIEQVTGQVKNSKTDFVSAAFLTRLREVIVEVSGPLGELLIEDVAEEMNLDLSKIPASKVTDFIYRIATIIPGEKQAAEFKKIMVQEIWNRKLN